jgi:uracil-DNA glycosylase
VATLAEMNRLFDVCPRCACTHNPLKHVYGGGATESPNYCFVLINPTYRNLSTSPLYEGPRFPFIGVRLFWKVLNRGGFFADEVLEVVERKPWTRETTSAVLTELKRQSIYLTNLVKCAQPHPKVPGREVFVEDMPLFEREMLLVKPHTIVAFGQLTLSVLTGETLKLGEYYRRILAYGIKSEFHFTLGDTMTIPVFPNFFPIGRGNPRLAAEILGLIKNRGQSDLTKGNPRIRQLLQVPPYTPRPSQKQKSSLNLPLI